MKRLTSKAVWDGKSREYFRASSPLTISPPFFHQIWCLYDRLVLTLKATILGMVAFPCWFFMTTASLVCSWYQALHENEVPKTSSIWRVYDLIEEWHWPRSIPTAVTGWSLKNWPNSAVLMTATKCYQHTHQNRDQVSYRGRTESGRDEPACIVGHDGDLISGHEENIRCSASSFWIFSLT